MTTTITYSELKVSRRAYFEIRKRLEDAGVLNNYTLGGRPEKILLRDIALKIDTDFDDSQDCRNCHVPYDCEIHS